MDLQFCDREANQDITGSPSRERDATEVRAWEEDGTLLGAAQRTRSGLWRTSGSDVTDWVRKARQCHRTWRDALGALGVETGEEAS